MSDHLPTPSPEPVRHDGWTAARQQYFLEVLADTGSVTMACRRVGMSRMAAYRLRRHPNAGDFRAAWDLALVEAVRQIEHVAIERALQGEEEVIERNGVVEVIRRRPCDARLLVRLLERAEERQSTQAAMARQIADLRALIDAQPDRRDWLPERPMTYQFETLDRLPPPLVLVVPDPSVLELRASRARIKPNL
ncbi:hypothetical protein CAP39_13345 [Sphingomonas sp. IBVSS1]|nr:hypothetical protein CAP39_13345 [Sphingomonas sp. IBVSS1]